MSNEQDGPKKRTLPGHSASRRDPKPTSQTVIGRKRSIRPAPATPATTPGLRDQTLPPAARVMSEAPPPEDDYCGYRLGDKIAEGGMGVVYRGEHKTLGRTGAIKLLKAEFCRDEEIVSRFYQEARAVNMIGHENIVEIYDFGRTSDGRVFFVMEFLEGESLADRIKRGPMSWTEARPILEQVLRALSAAHHAGMIHRDLKPDNIFLRTRPDGSVHVKVLDFGIAKLSGMDSPAEQLTKTGALIGTPHYMSPEQIDGAAGVDSRTDIYALGVILYQMFSGILPFHGDTVGAVIKGHLVDSPPPFQVPSGAEVPAGMPIVIDRMLAKKATERYESVHQVATDLVDVATNKRPTHASELSVKFPTRLGAAPAPMPGDGGPGVRAQPQRLPDAPPASKRSKAPLYALATVVALGIGGAGYYFGVVKSNKGAAGDGAGTGSAGQPVAGAADAGTAPDKPALDTAKLEADARALLRGGLREAEPKLRGAAVSALAGVGDSGSADPMKKLVADDPDLSVRGRAADALARLDADGSAGVVEAAYDGAPTALRVWLDEALVRLQDDRKARRRLTKAARDEDLSVSFKAALALADLSQSGDRDAVKALTKLAAREAELGDVAPYAGLLIVTKMARLSVAEARDILVKTLASEDEGARLAAADGLARLGDDAGKDALLAIMADEGSPNRLLAARSLVLIGEYSGFDVMTAKLGAKDPAVREQAARGLGQIGEQDSLAGLAKLLGDSKKPVQYAAAAAVLSILGLDPSVLSQASVDWAKNALSSEDWVTRLAAARTIGDLDQARAMPLFAAAFADKEAKVRETAARSARKLRGKQAAKALADAAKVETDRGVREQQVRALAAIGEPVAKEALTEIASGKGRVAVLASGALVAIGDVDAVSQIDDAMTSSSSDTRVAAAQAAAIARDPVVVPTLLVGIKDRLFKVRFVAAEALAKYKAGKDAAIVVLRKALGERDPTMQARAFAALLLFGESPDGGPEPAQMLSSKDAEVRLAAVSAIAALPWSKAAPLLIRAAADSDVGVRRAAVDAATGFARDHRAGVLRFLRRLTGNSDAVTRVKAQGQIAKLTGGSSGGKKATAVPAGDLDKLRAARDEVAQARGDVDAARAELSKLVKDIERATRDPAKDEQDVDKVEKLARDIGKAADKVKQARRTLQAGARRAQAAGRGVTGADADALKSEIASQSSDASAAVREAIDAGRKARRKAKDYARAETADPEIYLISAKTAIATGKLSAARRDLRKAEKLFKARGSVKADVYFEYGRLYARLAGRSSKDSKRKKYLERARSNFDRFASSGSGFRVSQARERSKEIAAELATLGGD